jgi:hypothetical protein
VAGLRSGIQFFDKEEKKQWIQEFVVKEMAAARKRVAEAEEAVERERERAEDMKLRRLAAGPTKMTFHGMMEAIGNNVEDVMTSDEDDDDEEDDEDDTDDTKVGDDAENEYECDSVVGTINQSVQQCLVSFRAKRMKLEELTASGWEDAEDYFREHDKKCRTAELKVLVNTNLNDISTAVETAEAITFSKFVDGQDLPLTAGKIPSHSRSYLRL